jgi:hypothetical protein
LAPNDGAFFVSDFIVQLDILLLFTPVAQRRKESDEGTGTDN